MAKRSNKGARIIKAAKKLIHQKGFHQTTLAHIAVSGTGTTYCNNHAALRSSSLLIFQGKSFS